MPLEEGERRELARLIEPKVHALPQFRQRLLCLRLGLEQPMNLLALDDDKLTDLAEHFEVQETADGSWPDPGLRLFVSHVAGQRGNFGALQQAFAAFGANFFLAHDNIEGGAAWRRALLDALRSMDAIVIIHSPGFRASFWCNQEVGYAVARSVPIIPIMHGEEPCGFPDDIQGFRLRAGEETALAEAVLNGLDQADRIPGRVGEALSKALKHVGSFGRSDEMIERLQQAREINDDAARQMSLAFRFNDQVYRSGGAHWNLTRLLERHGKELVAPEHEEEAEDAP